jgi:hypothetical protein
MYGSVARGMRRLDAHWNTTHDLQAMPQDSLVSSAKENQDRILLRGPQERSSRGLYSREPQERERLHQPMKCACICGCPNEADDRWEPRLCVACSLCESLDQSATPKHGLPYEAPKLEKLEPLEPITDAQKDKAIDTAMEGLI